MPNTLIVSTLGGWCCCKALGPGVFLVVLRSGLAVTFEFWHCILLSCPWQAFMPFHALGNLFAWNWGPRSCCAFWHRPPRNAPITCRGGELGLTHSNDLQAIVKEAKRMLEDNPEMSTMIIIPPNTPRYGFGSARSQKERRQGVKEARAAVKTALEHPGNKVIMKEVSCIIDAETMYSTSRDHHVNFWQLISNAMDPATNEERSHFAKGFSFSREAITTLVPIMPREEFRDWKDKFHIPSQGNLDPSLECKSWHTSHKLTSTVLSSAFKGLGLNSSRRAQVRHLTVWNSQVCQGVMMLNMEKAPHMPRLGYSGTCCQEGNTCIIANVIKACQDELMALVEKGAYSVKKFTPMSADPTGTTASTRPALKEEAFVITCPRVNGELPIRELELQKMITLMSPSANLTKRLEGPRLPKNQGHHHKEPCSKAALQRPCSEALAATAHECTIGLGILGSWGSSHGRLKDKVAKHNESKNQSGVTHKLKRTAPEGGELSDTPQPLEQAKHLPAISETENHLLEKGCIKMTYPGSETKWCMFLTADGATGYLQSFEDSVLENSTMLGRLCLCCWASGHALHLWLQ